MLSKYKKILICIPIITVVLFVLYTVNKIAFFHDPEFERAVRNTTIGNTVSGALQKEYPMLQGEGPIKGIIWKKDLENINFVSIDFREYRVKDISDIKYFKNAEIIVTDTFHGSIFSIINKKKFVTLVRKSIGNNYGNEEKLADLLCRLKLEDRIIYDISNLEKISNKEINYSDTNNILKAERVKAKKYLKECIK